MERHCGSGNEPKWSKTGVIKWRTTDEFYSARLQEAKKKKHDSIKRY